MTTSFTSPFASSRHAPILKRHQLNSFDAVWDYEIQWFEEPNQRRGGWSGVGRIALENGSATPLFLFVKKQQNHGRKTLLHPFSGEPTFRREFAWLQFLEARHFHAPKVAFYAERGTGKNQRAVLVTEALTEYQALDVLSEDLRAKVGRQQQMELIRKIAEEVRRFHDFGLVHRALYPKHIFVKNAEGAPDVALIDLEKARVSRWFFFRAYFDLAALNRHAEGWRLTQRLAFFKRYLRIEKLNFLSKVLCRLIIKRSRR